MTHHITTRWIEDLSFETNNPSGHTVIMDTKMEGADKQFGLSPKAMMLSSLAGCSGLDVISILNKMKATPENFKIEVFGALTDTDPKYYHAVTVDYHFFGKHLDKAKCEKAVKLSVEKYCGVMEMFRQFAEVTIKTHYHLS